MHKFDYEFWFNSFTQVKVYTVSEMLLSQTMNDL